MEDCQDTRKLLKGRIVGIEKAGGRDVYDIEVQDTHNYVANGILTSNSAADSYRKINRLCDNAFYRYGYTGTYLRPDGKDMEMQSVLSNVIFKKTTSELIEEGFLVRPHISVIRYEIKKGRINKRANYKDAYDFIVSDNEFHELTARIANAKIKEGKQTLVVVRRKEHGFILSKMIENCVYLSGEDDEDTREFHKKEFNEKRLPCIVATNIFGEGIDIPSIDVFINARAQKTEIQTAQGVGRALRKFEGKEKAEIFDFLIVGQKHLEAHSVERIMSFKKEPAFKISIIRSETLRY